MAADGQVTVGQTVMKQGAQKVRKTAKDAAVVGFAGGAADALALLERLEAQARDVPRQRAPRRGRARQGLAHRSRAAPARGAAAGRGRGVRARGLRQRRRDRARRRHRRDRARAAPTRWPPLAPCSRHTQLGAAKIAAEALRLAAEICIYTNDNVSLETLP